MVEIIDFKKIEKKWQKRWEESKIFEADPDPHKKKFFITFPYPYVNGAPHIGHSYSSFRTDAYARFKRMLGFNVLFPQGYHATGEPIVGAIKRLKENDPVQIETFKLFGVSDDDIEKFKKFGPAQVARFWMNRWIEDMKMGGFSIDWRRTFITTSITPQYSRFIEWQYNTLKKNGYVTQGTHPVIWCPHCQSPTGDHDRLEGEGESPIEYIIMKFRLEDSDWYIPCGTLRPETIYGVTNIWINPNIDYVKAKVNDETWIMSEECAKKLQDQLKDVSIEAMIKGEELVGKRCTDPLSNKKIPILPAEFVDPDNATGIVMSVPSHAPYDWIAIKELLDNPEELERYGVTSTELQPISLIKTPGMGEHPAVDICKEMDIKSSKDRERLDKATSIVYKKEFHQGVLKDNCGEYSGLKVSESKEKLIQSFIERGIADTMWECTDRVVCRCMNECHVKILENQWFLRFSDKNWKRLAKKCLKSMVIYPDEARQNFENTIDWLKDKACTRRTGMGTPLPWDKSWIVETLSDSTIYMAYYTIAKIINREKLQAEKLTDEVFDYIFFGKGSIKKLSKNANIDEKILKEMKREFDYFYPVDFRSSGKDLVQNHLTFFIFHHVAIWKDQSDRWPKGIGVNGFVNVEGEKMSKSKGNIIPLRDLMERYGVDMVRINIVGASEDLIDADWRVENIKGYRNRFEFLFSLVSELDKAKRNNVLNVDKYLRSRMQKHIKNTIEYYERIKFRSGINHSLFNTTNDLRWYLNRVGGLKNANKEILRETLSEIVRMLAPITPHVCEELWERLGYKSFVSISEWPKPNMRLINRNVELSEEMIKQTLEDVQEIIKLVNRKVKKVYIFIAPEWKFKIYKKFISDKLNVREIMRGLKDVDYIQTLLKKKKELPEKIVERNKQQKTFQEAKQFLEKELGCEVVIVNAEESENPKAKQADVLKPGIYVE